MNLVIAEDDKMNARLLEQTFKHAGHQVVVAHDGVEALQAIRKEQFGALITDWMMPHMDGIELTREARTGPNSVPIVIFVTTLDCSPAREFALKSGADDYLVKPYEPLELLACLENCRARLAQIEPAGPPTVALRTRTGEPPYPVVCIAASTGGPPAITQVLKELPERFPAPVFVMQHGPGWMVSSFAALLGSSTGFQVELAEAGALPKVGEACMAPADYHLRIEPETMRLELADTPLENFVRPSADPLFRSVAATFGRHSLAVILTGMGCDGAAGAQHIAAAEGTVIVQHPDTAVAKGMPQTVIDLGVPAHVIPLSDIAEAVNGRVHQLADSIAEMTV